MPLLRLCAALLIASLLLVVPVPIEPAAKRWPALIMQIQDAAHIGLFAGLTWMVWRVMRRFVPRPGWAAYPLAFVITVGFGLATEAVQSLFGRDSSWMDLAGDASGALGSLLLIGAAQPRSSASGRITRRIVATCGLVVLAAALAPLAWTIGAYMTRAMHSPLLWNPDSRVLQVFAVRYPGAGAPFELTEVPFTRKDFDAVDFTLRNLTAAPLVVDIHVYGKRHRRRPVRLWSTHVSLYANEVRPHRISSAQFRDSPHWAAMDLNAVTSLVFVQRAATQHALWSLDELRLARSSARALSPIGD